MAVGRHIPQWHPWILLAAALAAMTAMSLAGAQVTQVTIVRSEVPAAPVSTNDTVTVPIVIDSVTNLGAFDFQVSFDPAILKAEKVETGPFLGSSGREVNCPKSSIDEGSVRLTCVTLGATPAGPTGSGVLATLVFKPVASGTSPLRFEQLTLTDPPGTSMPAQGQDSSLTVVPGADSGFAWALWGPVIGVGVLALGAAAVWVAWRARRSRRA